MWGRDFSKLYISIILPWLFLFTANTFSEEYFLYWKYSTDIDINTVGVPLTDNITEFPLLVRLNSLNFDFSQAKSDGTDIRFIKPDGSALPYEIERWDDTGQLAEIWVKVDTVYKINDTQYLTMFWGNPDAPDISNSEDVFKTSNNFTAVWHLKDENYEDATSNNYDGTDYVSHTGTGGVVGNGKQFDGNNDFISVTGGPTLTNFTAAFWFQPHDLVSRFNALLGDDGWNFIGIKGENDDKLNYYVSGVNFANTTLFGSIWYYGAITRSGTSVAFYLDGSPDGTAVITLADSLVFDKIGSNDYNDDFNGFLDEIQISSVARSADWVKLSYETQKSTQTIVTVNPSTSAAKITLHPLSGNVTVGQTASFTVDAVGEPDPSFQWQKNGADLPGDTLATYSIPSVAVADAGDYRAIAINIGGTDTSNAATLTVITDSMQITRHPVSDTVELNSHAQFFVIATGNPAPEFKWLKDGALLPAPLNDTLSIAAAQFSDAGVYRAITCVGIDSDTSNEATLLVYDTSSIIQVHPVNDTVLAGQEAQFFIVPTGGGVSYQWQLDSGVWADLGPETSDTLKISTVSGDDGNKYRCIVSSGPKKDTSSHAMLTIATVPVTTSALPSDTAIGVGSDMTFTAAATAKPNPAYTWYMKPTLTDDSTEVGAEAILAMTGITKQNAGYYFFKADNRFGTTFSSNVQLFVNDPVNVVSDLPAKYYVVDGGAAVLNPDVTGEGDITYQWYENSVLVPGQTTGRLSINPVDSATHDGNTYYCSITNTFNTYPIGTVTTRVCTLVVSKYSNPFKVKAERIDIHNTTQVRVKLWSDVDISNFPSTSSLARWADSVWVFYKTFGYANNPAEATVVRFAIDDIKNAADTLQTVLTTGKLPAQHDSSFYFNYSVLWHDPPLSIDTLLMPLSQANKVFLVDTLSPLNVLTVHGEYQMLTDTALIIIDSIAKLDPVFDSLVVIQVSNMPQFDPIIFHRELDIPTLIAGGTSSTVTMDNLGTLPLELDTLYCRWYIFAKSGAEGIPADTSFTIGWPRPVYTGTLAADSTDYGGQLQLTWDAPGNSVDSIRVWWNTDTIPLNFEFTLPISQAQYMAPTSIHDTIEGLDNDAWYWAGLQIFQNMMWSRVTPASRAFAKTARGDTSKVPNIISCDSSWFEDSTNTMVIQWHIDTLKAPVGRTYQAGYIYGLDTDSVVDTNNTVDGWIDLTQNVNITRIQLFPDIVFDTTYSVGLWLRGYSQVLGQGKKSQPTDSSITQVRIPTFTWQYVTFFDGKETVSAANQEIILKSIANFNTSDTLWAFKQDLLLPGIEPVGGVHFRFGNPQLPIASIILGLTYDSLPPGITPNDLRMYQWNNGLHVRHGSWADSVAVWDTVRMTDLPYPFLVLADTVAPTISITQAYNDTIVTGLSIPTWFGINDNIVNSSWQFLYGPGHEGYIYSANGYAGAYNDTTLKAMILNQGNVINESFGVRALIVAHDNIRSDTLNVSRSVKTIATEAISVIAHEWVPLRSTAGLDAPALEEVFTRSLGDGTAWEYDIHNYRLYRWYDGAGVGQNSWLEYSDPVKDVFAFEPGRLIWFKSLENQTVTFGPGVTTSLKEAYEIVLTPKNWTDITLPYKFPVMLRDILEATGSPSDMLEVYHWKKNDKSYEGVDLYIASLDNVSSVTDTIQSKKIYDGYTVYNHSTAPVSLRIPPISLPLSNYAGAKRKKTVQSDHTWNIHFMWKNLNDGKESFFRRLRCGFRKSESKKRLSGFLPPTMSKIQVGITDPQRHTLHGWALEPSLANDGISFTVSFTNSSDVKAKIAYYLDNLGVLPDDFVAGMLDPKTHKYEDCTPKKAAEVKVSAKSSTQRVIVIGTKAYLENMIMGYLPMKLVKAFPNPFNGKIRIQYRIPIGISEVRFTLFNLRGQRIWRGIERKNLMPGRHTYFFDSRAGKKNALPAGVYIMRMTAKNKKGKVLYGGKRKLTCIK